MLFQLDCLLDPNLVSKFIARNPINDEYCLVDDQMNDSTDKRMGVKKHS